MVRPTAKHVSEETAPQGEMGQLYLAAGERVGMRLWDEEPTTARKAVTAREYETVGYVLEGRAILVLGDKSIELKPGDSWLVPAGVEHTYEILEHFRSVEATSPPGQQGGMDSTDRLGGRQFGPDDVLA